MASFLSGLGYAAGAAAKAGLSTYEQLEAMDKAEREKKAYEEEQAYKAELKGAVAPATAEQRQGFQVTGLGNKPFYIPADSAQGAREAYTNAGYTVGDTATPYQEMTTSRVAPGTTGIGKYYEQQSTADPARQIEADTAMTEYNAAGAGLGRQRDVALKYGKFSEAGALDTLSEAPERKKALGLSIKAAEQSLDIGKLNLTAQQRVATNNEAVDAVSKLMAQAEALPPGDKQRVRIEGEIKAKTAGLPFDVQSSMVSLAKVKADLKRATDEEAYIKSVVTPEAFVKHFNEQLKNGENAKIIKNKDGTTSIVTTKDDNPEYSQERFRFKEWGDKERNKALSASPAFAKAKFEADITHANRMEQIKETGKLASARTAMLVKGKEIKMSPETRTELKDIGTKRTELLSKGEALTPAEEKELQKLELKQDAIINMLAIDNNQLPALLRSGDSRYRTDNPPPRAGAKQTVLNPNEWETTKDQMRASLAASMKKSFTDMEPASREKYLDDKMAEKYVRKGARPAQGASVSRGVVNDDTAGRLKAIRDKEITDLTGSADAE